MAGYGSIDVSLVPPSLEAGAKGKAQVTEVLLPLPPPSGCFGQHSLHDGDGPAKVVVLPPCAEAAEKEPAALTKHVSSNPCRCRVESRVVEELSPDRDNRLQFADVPRTLEAPLRFADGFQ